MGRRGRASCCHLVPGTYTQVISSPRAADRLPGWSPSLSVPQTSLTLTHSKSYAGTQYTHKLSTAAIHVPRSRSSWRGAHTDTASFLFSLHFISKLISQATCRAPCGWDAVPSLTQGVRVTLHRLVDLPRNSGHRLTHLPQHADAGVLLPATRPVCCSQGGLHLGKTQGRKSPARWPGTWAAGRLQGELQAACLLLRGPEPRPHPAWPSKQLICPSEGGGSLVLPVSWQDRHV